MSTAPHRSLADLWAVSNLVQRTSWLERAAQVTGVIAEHSKKDWFQLPPKVMSALMGVKK